MGAVGALPRVSPWLPRERQPSNRCLSDGVKSVPSRGQEQEVCDMFRDIILWVAGVPIVVIVLLHVTGFIHY